MTTNMAAMLLTMKVEIATADTRLKISIAPNAMIANRT
jgi:hypothetical protein